MCHIKGSVNARAQLLEKSSAETIVVPRSKTQHPRGDGLWADAHCALGVAQHSACQRLREESQFAKHRVAPVR
jgi:hypothetical protein